MSPHLWLREHAKPTGRLHRVKPWERGRYTSQCQYADTTQPLVEDARALKCGNCLRLERRGNGINRREG